MINNEIYNKVVELLTIREHSKVEIISKLINKGYQKECILTVITELQQQNLQSDSRFSEVLVRSRFNQGKGSLFIKQQLKQHNISDYSLEGYDFYQLALSVRVKKYGNKTTKNYQEKTKQMRFLQSRGFSFDEINFAIK